MTQPSMENEKIVDLIHENALTAVQCRAGMVEALQAKDREKAELENSFAEYRKGVSDMRDKSNTEISQLKTSLAKCVGELKHLCSVVNTVNYGKDHEMIVPSDDEPVLPQRKEWVEYLLEENKKAEEALTDQTGARAVEEFDDL